MSKYFYLIAFIFFSKVTVLHASEDEVKLEKDCKTQDAGSCALLGLSKLQKKDEVLALKFLKQACDLGNCISLAGFYEVKGKFQESRSLLKKGCKNKDHSFCYSLSKFEKDHGTIADSKKYLMIACDLRYYESSCKKAGIQDNRPSTKINKELKEKLCKGEDCSHDEEIHTQAAQFMGMFMDLKQGCDKNIAENCNRLALMYEGIEKEMTNDSKKGKAEFLNFKKGLIEEKMYQEPNELYKKACDLKYQVACENLKKK